MKIGTPIDWYDSYNGPKSLGWEDGQFVCLIGYNVRIEGGARGYILEFAAHTADDAILGAKELYESQLSSGISTDVRALTHLTHLADGQ
jgi:hypothetical protein